MRKRPPLGRRKKLRFAAICTLVASAVAYLIFVVVLSERLYSYVTSNQRAVHGGMIAADGELGYAAVPGARAESVFPVGPSMRLCTDLMAFCAERHVDVAVLEHQYHTAAAKGNNNDDWV